MISGSGCVLLLSICFLGLVSSFRIEINSNIILSGDWDYWPQSNGRPRCYDMLDKVAGYSVSRVQFVPTQFWVGYDGPSFVDRKVVDFYCHKVSGGNCVAFDQQAINNFRENMKLCFQYAINKGLDITLSPHLDDGLELGGWRNTIRFDPMTKYGGFSYADIMIYPLADALAATANANTKVWFGMQGEMAATVIFNPNSYAQLVPLIKSRIADNGLAQTWNIKVGLGLNFNKICGCVLLDLVDPTLYLQQFPAAIAPIIDTFDLVGLQGVFQASDFVGISNYASLTPNFAEPELQNAIYQFDRELQYFNVSIRKLTLQDGKELHFSEYGVGGGTSIGGGVQATTEAEVAATPFFGVYGPYRKSTDPWGMYLDYLTPARKYLHYYYNQTINMVSKGIVVNPNANINSYRTQYIYRIDAIYLWNQNSWDVQAIYPTSTSSEGSYYDAYVNGIIRAHNIAL
eukprot:TRINITY_DN2248_c0_g1_i2.p1 TRINITY_DN2248_c0_g1~~TRINITY_DN2248_c0_g1_i2.p1  ORF type:complete len:458 (+),score=41.31 TRINITY_DN2248_c0_g1_i2:706-2079(+)